MVRTHFEIPPTKLNNPQLSQGPSLTHLKLLFLNINYCRFLIAVFQKCVTYKFITNPATHPCKYYALPFEMQRPFLRVLGFRFFANCVQQRYQVQTHRNILVGHGFYQRSLQLCKCCRYSQVELLSHFDSIRQMLIVLDNCCLLDTSQSHAAKKGLVYCNVWVHFSTDIHDVVSYLVS